MKKILVTNDDGITAGGIRALVEVAREFGEVVVVAPDSPQSGMGHALTITEPLRLKSSTIFGEIESYECTGTPVDCVKLAKSVLYSETSFDLCLSGINHGSNAAVNILYSGTVSAAMEAAIEGIDSVAFSLLDLSAKADFEASKLVARKIIAGVLENKLADCKLLNVNIPKVSGSDLKGIQVCRQSDSRWTEKYMEAIDPRGEKYYWLTGEFLGKDKGPGTDIWALENNYVSVVPSGHDLTVYPALESQKYLNS